jgi:hypothetical protein
MKNRKSNPLGPETIRKYTLAAAKLKHLLRDFSRPDQVKQKDAAMVKKLLASTPNMANKVLRGREIEVVTGPQIKRAILGA